VTSAKIDVAVVGAGISGLVAARRLSAAGASIAVLEARDRVGGRAESVEVGGQVVDLGGQWLGATHARLAGLADELGVTTFPQHVDGTKVIERQGRRATFNGFFPRLPLLDVLELGYRMVRLDRMARRVSLADPSSCRRAGEWDALSLDDWLAGSVRTEGARDLLRLAAQMVFAAEPRDLSFLFFLFYLHAGDGIRRLTESRGGAQDRRFAGGAQEIARRLADPLGSALCLGRPARSVEQDDGGVTLATSTGELAAGRVILALPPAMLDRIAFRPALPAARATLHRDMPGGSILKCVAAYERPFWREAGYSGEAFSTDGAIRAVFDDSSADGNHAALVAFAPGDAARRLGALPAEERRRVVVAELVRHFGDAAARPIAYADKDWSADPWSAGCYTGVAPPGLLTAVGRSLRGPCGRIHFAGTETATHHVGYFEGAVEAGLRAAEEVLAGQGAAARSGARVVSG
jgi:monoamine oxidase